MPEPHVADVYARLPGAAKRARQLLGRPVTFAEKVLYAHLFDDEPVKLTPGSFAQFRPDRVALQDATAQMALLQFMSAGLSRTAVPTTVHCDHFIQARAGAVPDLAAAKAQNAEVYDFLAAAADKFGIGFWEPGSGIIHQVVLENYAFPGGLIIGADSHTPNAGGLGMLGIGVGGSDAVDAMAGLPWELPVPRLIGVQLSGHLSGWTSAKDIILHLAGLLTTKGATNAIIEYFGPGVASLSATGRATVCNMGAELGATSSLFGYDVATARYLAATGRVDVAQLAGAVKKHLRADPEVEQNPGDFFDQVIEIDLDTLQPHVNGPFTPDAATPIAELADKAKENGWPLKIEAAMVGSCTNSSYQDLARAADVAKHALAAGKKLACPLYINPGSAQTEATAERDGLLEPLRQLGAVILANACGPCIGQWQRQMDNPARANSIVTSYNRNFAKRADGNPNTHAFVASPEIVVALALGGRLDVNPLADEAMLPPVTETLPPDQFVPVTSGFKEPTFSDSPIVIKEGSSRLAPLAPFPAWNGQPLMGAPLLIKVAGKCTTDHISPAGRWLAYRGNLARISDNLLLGATNAFTGRPGVVTSDGQTVSVAEAARSIQAGGRRSVIVAEDNYGEGSSREHAAMEPRYLGVAVVLAKSFARIHETNLKKQGLLALTFVNPSDYDHIQPDDRFSLPGLPRIAPGRPLAINVSHKDGKVETILAAHSYTDTQIGWLRAGSALAAIRPAASQAKPVASVGKSETTTSQLASDDHTETDSAGDQPEPAAPIAPVIPEAPQVSATKPDAIADEAGEQPSATDAASQPSATDQPDGQAVSGHSDEAAEAPADDNSPTPAGAEPATGDEPDKAVSYEDDDSMAWGPSLQDISAGRDNEPTRPVVVGGQLPELDPDKPSGVRVVPYMEGDGIGPEITAVMREIVDTAVQMCYGGWRRIEWLEVPAGRQAFDRTGMWLPDETLQACRDYPVSIKGPLETPVGGGIRSLNVTLRRSLDLYACVRPVRWFEGVTSPLREPSAVDMVVFRENTEDVYAGIEWQAGSDKAKRFAKFLADEMGVTDLANLESSAFGVKPMSREASQRLVRAACRYAIEHDRDSVTLVHKGNIMKYTEGGFRQWGYEVAESEFPQLKVTDVIADAFLQNSLLTPRQYSVVATPNLNGDYISDQLAAMVGGIGIAPGANINYETGHAMFEATHGTAPTLVGTGRANPSSLLLSAAMMLDYMGWSAAAQRITEAMAACFKEGLATRDIVPDGELPLTTDEFGSQILARLVV